MSLSRQTPSKAKADEEVVAPTVVQGHTFTVPTRYTLTDSHILGKGSYGLVCTGMSSSSSSLPPPPPPPQQQQ